MLPLLYAIILIILIIIPFALFNKEARLKRKLKKAPLIEISDFREGQIAKIVGEVEFIDSHLFSPLSMRKCTYYYVHIEQKVSSGKSTRWKTIVEEEVSCKFLIKQGKYVAYINDNNIKSHIVQDRYFSSRIFNEPTPTIKKYLRSKGVSNENFLGMNKTLRYKEGILEHGERVAVLGKGEWKTASSLDLPEIYNRVLEVTSESDHAIYLSDDPDTTRDTNKNEFDKL